MLSQSDLVVFSWPAGPVPETDGDTLPDAVDQCEASDLSPTVVIDTCDSGALNDLDVDGCTIADRIAAVAADAANHGQFVSGVAQLTQQLQQQRAITSSERQALLRCAAKADLP
jgi:hypothetical protein